MKTLLVTLPLAALFCMSCQKSSVSPVKQELESNAQVSNEQNTLGRFTIAAVGKVPDLNGGPNDPACIDGGGSCIEVIVTPLRVVNLGDAIENGLSATQSYLSNEVVDDLSDGGSNLSLKNALLNVANGEGEIIEMDMPNAEGNKRAFAIGESNVSLTNHEIVVIYGDLD